MCVREGWKRRKKREELPCPVVPSPHVAWEQPEIPVLIHLMPEPKPGGFLPCPIAHGRYLSPVHLCRNPSESSCTDHPAKQQSSLTVIPYSPSWMEPLQASDIPCSQDSIKSFSTQGLYPTREVVAKGPQELFSNNSCREELDYLQLTQAQTNHKFTANNSQQEGGVSTAFQAITEDRVGVPGVEAESNFCKALLKLRGHPGDQRPSHQSQSWLVFFFFFKSSDR